MATIRTTLPGRVGEENVYRAAPRGTVLCIADTEAETIRQEGAATAAGNHSTRPGTFDTFDAVLFAGPPSALTRVAQELSARPGPLIPFHTADSTGRYPTEWLVL